MTNPWGDRLVIEKHVIPQVLLLASRFDLSCDYVVAQLRRRGRPYFRLNSEDFEQFAIIAVPSEPGVYLDAQGLTIQLNPETLKAIYPGFPRSNQLSWK